MGACLSAYLGSRKSLKISIRVPRNLEIEKYLEPQIRRDRIFKIQIKHKESTYQMPDSDNGQSSCDWQLHTD